MRHCVIVVLALAAAGVGGCRGSRTEGSERDLVARAAGRDLTVGEAARLMASNGRVTVDPRSVGVVAGLWVDYTLLDSALRADSALARANLAPLIAAEREQAIVMKLRDRAISVDTSFSDAEVARLAQDRGIHLEPDAAEREAERDRMPQGNARDADKDEEIRELRRALAASAQQRAEGAYLDSVVGASGLELTDRGLDVMRDVAARPSHALDAATANQPIARYRGGALTAGTLAHLLQREPFELQASLAAAPSDQLETEVRRLVTTQLLLREAARQGITLTRSEDDAIRSRVRAAVDSSLVRVTALLTTAGGVPGAPRGAGPLVQDAIRGRGRVVPLGALGVVVRGMYEYDVEPESFPRVVQRVNALRSAGAPAHVPPDTGDNAR